MRLVTVLDACAMQVELGKRKEPEPMLPPPPKPAGAAMPPPGRPAPASMPPPPVQPLSSALPPPVSAPTQLPPPPRPALVSCNSNTCMHQCLQHSWLPHHALATDGGACAGLAAVTHHAHAWGQCVPDHDAQRLLYIMARDWGLGQESGLTVQGQ